MNFVRSIVDFFARVVFNYRPNDKHIWVTDIDDTRLEHEIYAGHLNDPKLEDLCKVYNLIPDNPHEGLGWWEKVVVYRDLGFSIEEKVSVFRQTDLNDMTSSICTYLPQEVLHDIRNAPGNVIGFRPHIALPGTISSVVWIHYK